MFVKKVQLKTIKKIGVCGAGTMGSGIAQLAAQCGFRVILFDVQDEVLQKSKASIEKNLTKLVEKNKLDETERKNIIQQINHTNNLNDCVADVIIEAVVEKKEIKQQLFDDLSIINTGETIFATNTSSISIHELSIDKDYAERFAGLHFFNPPVVMQLVEIIRSPCTKEDIIDTLVELSKKLNKTPVVCNDAPGFIVNRVARHYYLEAMHLLEENIAGVETIDAIMKSTGFKMGPLELMDLIGIDVNYSVSEIVWNALHKPGRLKPSVIQKNKIDNNELGRKTGKGFYEY